MSTILRHIEYMPDHWKGAAHTTSVRNEFSNLFTYKMTHLLSEVSTRRPLISCLAFGSGRTVELCSGLIETGSPKCLIMMLSIPQLFSPLVTPLIIIGPLRSRALQIVKFFCENTISIEGVGDVCSFAQMDIATHGDPEVGDHHAQILFSLAWGLEIAMFR